MTTTDREHRSFAVERHTVNEIEVAVQRAGSGQPLLFLHGGSTAPGADFALRWAEHFEVVIPHHPGFGLSADDPGIRDMRDFVPHYLQLLDDLGISSADVVGHSLGGWIAALLAIHSPDRVRRLALASPAGLRVPDHPTLDILRLEPPVLATKLTRNPQLLFGSGEPSVDAIVAGYRESGSLARVLWERNYDHTLQRWLHRVAMPTLLVWGRDDEVTPVRQAEAWSARLPHSETLIVECCGHLLLNEQPDVADAITAFLLGDGPAGP
ncbi:alpha/beta fold hydrolase [Pseudonocardia bannensis]|uniref:Alpha/beta hydrolase n=1 Tax=Pseudonocardia bannensis TaxID=630973 RepID=A0A848DFK0_9PSEU|nr:alpha/beta hydrolase [Pseudonocardia bannensis]NMH91397.1 alpha/beta hydrolase [Pseudonocardia bannensis]